jgi:uncharacterized membrane protein
MKTDMKSDMKAKNYKTIKMALIGVGLIDSLYLLITTYLDFLSEICPLNGCGSLIYNGINIPALLGLIWFSLYNFTGRFLRVWQILGALGIVILSAIAFYTSYFCPYCFVAYLTGICLIAIDFRSIG